MHQDIEFEDVNKCGIGHAHPVEKAYHLRHGRHFNLHGGKPSGHGAHEEPANDPGVISNALARIVLMKRHGSQNGQSHAQRRQNVAPPGSLGIPKHLQTKNKKDGCYQVGNCKYVLLHKISIGSYFFFLNISSMRSVTTKPPTTLSVPSTTSRTTILKVAKFPGSACPIIIVAPMIPALLFALAPHIKGVCSADCTFVITSNPINMET